MPSIKALRLLRESDYSAVRDVYADSVHSLAVDLYNKEQIDAWSSIASLPGVLDKTLTQGKGWLSFEKKELAAFAVRYPINRMALLYCRGRFSRRGHATVLVRRLEIDAQKDGCDQLITEASLLSYRFLLNLGWTVIRPEKIAIAGVLFDRFIMQKILIDKLEEY